MESASVSVGGTDTPQATGKKGLKANAIGFWDGLSIGLASTAPAYSIAAVIGLIVAAVGVKAPGVLLLSFVPMFFIAAAFFHMNRVDTDCGTTFSWVTRGMGPYVGWMGGWAICTTGILVIGSLADVSAYYFYDLTGLEADGKPLFRSEQAVAALAVLIITVMTWICVIGTEISARMQRIFTLGQVAILLLFAGAVFGRLILDKVPERSISPELGWLSPFGVEYSGVLAGVLLAVFIYWGWESAVNLSEESEDSSRAPGLAGLASTVILVFTYIAVAIAVIAYAGADQIANRFADDPGVLGAVGADVLGSTLGNLLVIAVIISGISSAQTTILPGSRTSLSMAAAGAFPKQFASIHPRFLTPTFGTIVIGILATAWYVPGKLISENFLFDSLSALSLMIAFYYGLTGLACVIYWRRELTKSAKDFLFIGVAPLIGSLGLFYLLFESVGDLADPKASYSGSEVFGLGVPLVIAIVFIGLGFLLMLAWRLIGPPAGREFFARRAFEAVPPEVASGEVAQVEAIGVSEAAADAGEVPRPGGGG